MVGIVFDQRISRVFGILNPVFYIEPCMGIFFRFFTFGSEMLWLDPFAQQNGIQYAKNARDALIKNDPDHKEDYEKNAEAYIGKLQKLHNEAVNRFKDIPKERRVLVTCRQGRHRRLFQLFPAAC